MRDREGATGRQACRTASRGMSASSSSHAHPACQLKNNQRVNLNTKCVNLHIVSQPEWGRARPHESTQANRIKLIYEGLKGFYFICLGRLAWDLCDALADLGIGAWYNTYTSYNTYNHLSWYKMDMTRVPPGTKRTRPE